MAAFGFKTEKNEIVDKFVEDTNNRLNSANIMKNPFNGFIRRISQVGSEAHYGVCMKPIYFPFYWFGLLLAFVAFYFNGFKLTWLMGSGLTIFALGIFYSGGFFLAMLKVGLRKSGYKGKIKRISKDEIIYITLKFI